MTESASLFAKPFDGIPVPGADHLAPDAITSDIANASSQYPTLFSRESWEQYCVAKHGPKASVLAGSLFDHIAKLDGVNDGALDITGLHAADVMEVFGFGMIDAVFEKFDTSSDPELSTIKNAIREDLNLLHHNSGMRSYRGELYLTKVGENHFFAVLGDTDYARMITSADLNTAWERARALHPDMEWMRVVTHAGYHVGDTNNPLDPDHQMNTIARMQSDLLVTGGVGVVRATGEMWIAPAGSVSDCIDPSVVDSLITGGVALAYLAFAIVTRGRGRLPQLPAVSGSGGQPSRINRVSTFSREILGQLLARLNKAKASGRRFVTTYMGDAPKEQPEQPYVELSMDLSGLKTLFGLLRQSGRRGPSGRFVPADDIKPEATPPPESPVAASSLAGITTVTRDQVRIVPTHSNQPVVFTVSHGDRPKGQEVDGDVIFLRNRSVNLNHLHVRFNPVTRQLDVKGNPNALGGTHIGYDTQRPTVLAERGLTVTVPATVKKVVFHLAGDMEVELTLPPIPRSASGSTIPVVQAPTATSADVRLSQPLQPLDLGGEAPSGAQNPPLDATRNIRQTVPIAGPVAPPAPPQQRDTEPQSSPPLQVTWARGMSRLPVTPPAQATTPRPLDAKAVTTIKSALSGIPDVLNVQSSEVDRTIYAGAASPNGNRVSVAVSSSVSPDVAGMVVRHMAPILAGEALPVPVAVSVRFEPDASFESLCRVSQFSSAALARAKVGGIVRLNIEGQGVKPVDETVDDAAVVSMIRITGRDLARSSGIMKVDLILPQSAACNADTVNTRLNNVKEQLLAKLWSTSQANVPVFMRLFPQL